MAKEPWQEDIYDQEETRTERSKRKQGGGVIANRILTIGILGKYISKIYLETKKRPLYLIKEKSDLPILTEKNREKRL